MNNKKLSLIIGIAFLVVLGSAPVRLLVGGRSDRAGAVVELLTVRVIGVASYVYSLVR